MRIHLPLNPSHFEQPQSGPSSSPLVKVGGDLVLIELQGELSWEGERSNGVIGLLGFDRPDKPTLHLGPHHLLHGKISTLQKPYAVIRRVFGDVQDPSANGIDEVDEDDDGEDADNDDDRDDEETPDKRRRTINGKDEEEEEEDGPLFPPETESSRTPNGSGHPPSSSSPIYPSSAPRDYSSELDMSSPGRFDLNEDDEADEDEDEDEEQKRRREEDMRVVRLQKEKEAKRKEKRKREKEKSQKQRTRHYEVVGVVRKKVVFALRPEPIVTATVLPD